jgi:tetratricopeptide (TPR) repeat protein
MATKKKDVTPQSSLPAEVQAQLKELDIPIYAYDPVRVEGFLRGHLTLGELAGVSKESQYQMAKVGHDFMREGKFDAAQKVFAGLQALDPFDAYFHMCLAAIAEELKEPEKADQLYTRSLEINPFSPVALANRGALRLEAGRFEEAVRDLAAAVREDPEGKEPSTRRARVLLQMLKQTLDAAKADPEGTARAAREQLAALEASKGGTTSKAPAAKAATTTQAKAAAAPAKAPAKAEPTKPAAKAEPAKKPTKR